MPNLLATGSAWLGRMMANHAAESLVYRRRNGSSSTLALTPGETEASGPADASIVTIHRASDYLVPLVDFETAFGSGARPEAGDVVVVGSTEKRVGPLGNEPAWRFCDSNENRLRIHTEAYRSI